MRTTRPWIALIVLALIALTPTGCLWFEGRFDPLQKGDAFDVAQKRFTRFVRWNMLDKAAELVDPALRQDFLDETRDFRKLRFTDYEVLVRDLSPDLSEATVDVAFYAYTMSTMVERVINIREEWYRDEETGRWRVRPRIEGKPSAVTLNTP